MTQRNTVKWNLWVSWIYFLRMTLNDYCWLNLKLQVQVHFIEWCLLLIFDVSRRRQTRTRLVEWKDYFACLTGSVTHDRAENIKLLTIHTIISMVYLVIGLKIKWKWERIFQIPHCLYISTNWMSAKQLRTEGAMVICHTISARFWSFELNWNLNGTEFEDNCRELTWAACAIALHQIVCYYY